MKPYLLEASLLKACAPALFKHHFIQPSSLPRSMTNQNPYRGWDIRHPTGQPTLGALPYYQPPSQPSLLIFELSGQPDILNCCMIGADRRPHPIVIPDPASSRVTLVQSVRRERLATIEWMSPPVLTIGGGTYRLSFPLRPKLMNLFFF